MKKLLFLMGILFLINPIYAQKKYLEKNKKYPTAKIYQRGSSDVLKVKNLTLSEDMTLFYNDVISGANDQKQISTENIRYIAIKEGTYAGRYAIAGGGVGLLSAIIGVLDVKSDPTLDDSGVNWVPFIAGFTAGGAALGAFIGSCKPRWKIHYIEDKKTSYEFTISPAFEKNYFGLGLTVRF